MEIEKKQKKETTWIIKRRDAPGAFILKSEEETGSGNTYSVSMRQNEYELSFDMKKEEFLNFISILNGFKDVALSIDVEDDVEELPMPSNESSYETGSAHPPIMLEKVQVSPRPAPKPAPSAKSANPPKKVDNDLDPTEWDPF
ncbi:MAG TPA: hypothetical protein VKK79_16545 [Candidatus Lokiarchaeia archaeon]|nr:hypothetical protein [Candidatus Lokiarchaeia archaeon]